MTRVILVIHRYLGVVVGLVMVLWCLSGFVMMYQGYPRLADEQRLRGLTALQLPPNPVAIGAAAAAGGVTDDAVLTGFSLEMRAGVPLLQWRFAPGPGLSGERQSMDLRTGSAIGGADAGVAMQVARDFAAGNGIAGQPSEIALIKDDQWTVEGASRRGPLHLLRFNDDAGTELYVAARTGQATQLTNTRIRFWSWLGAVPHWLYPLVLRRNGALWDQVVVWTSLVGVFLTVTGAWVGIAHFRRQRNGRWSPFRGWFYWHHILGLIFGLLVLSWVASGLFTMNPWGFLATEVGFAERAQLAGSVKGADLKHFLAAVVRAQPSDVVQLQSAPLDGQFFALAVRRDGSTRRLNVDGVEQPVTELELKSALNDLTTNTGGAPLAALTRQDHEDAYYYSGYERTVTLPVYRAQLANADATTYYLDATSGQIVDAYDSVARQSRWLRTGLHDFDFSAGLRQRPVWDLVVLLLLVGVTSVCVTGAWMAILRVKRDFQVMGRKWRGRREAR